MDLDDIVAAVSAAFGCTAEQILTKAKKQDMARDAAIYLARESANLKGTHIGHYSGDISGAAVTMRHKNMAEQIMINKPQKCTNGSWHGLKTPENTRTADGSWCFTQSSLKGYFV